MTRLAPFLLLLFLACGALQAANLPAGFSETRYGGAGASLPNPTAMAFAPDGRLFVCLQDGRLRVIKQGTLLTTPFLTVGVDSQGERGLLGVAFDPNFTTNPFIYIYYTTSTLPVHNRVSRFTANGDIATAGSEVVIFELDNLSVATNHNGGAIHFGKDGNLYVASGENANPANAQSLNTVLGKILRINADGTIPADNPFFTQTTGRNRAIWSLGLRNPFTFSFQPGTGTIFINDVGQNLWEEIDEGIAGSNYGWPTCEGECLPPVTGFTNALYAYTHADTGGCAITGGTFYNPLIENFPSPYSGKYFFADYCGGFISVFDPVSRTVTPFATALQFPVDLQIGPDGSLYYLQAGNGGQVWRVRFDTGPAMGIPQRLTPRVPQAAETDYDGDGKTDIAVYRRRDGTWYIRPSSSAPVTTRQWGAPGDTPVPGDFDGDGKSDFAVWRRSEGVWYIIQSSSGFTTSRQWGAAGDLPVPADYDGDGKTDLAVWRRTRGVWYVIQSSNDAMTARQWGLPGDVPVPADYDGDGKTDLAVWRESDGLWYVIQSSNGVMTSRQWGLPGDTPVTGDFDGDGKSDFTVWRESDGLWYVLQSSNGATTTQLWGIAGDAPVTGDFDGDGKSDFTVWRETDGIWYIIQSSNGARITQQWGASGEVPVSSPLN